MNIIFKTKMSNHHLYPNQSDSTSLWNYSLFPGWSEEEVEVLKIALIKYGIGHWTRIQKVNCLPGKTIVQKSHFKLFIERHLLFLINFIYVEQCLMAEIQKQFL